MRIGIEAQRIFRAKKHGMDFVALETIRGLQQLDRENEYYVFVSPGDDHCLQESANFHIVEINCPTYPLWEQVALSFWVYRLKLDVLHCTSNTAPLFCSASLVATIHDVIYMEPKPKGNSSLYQNMGWYYRRFVVPKIARKCTKIITVSAFERERIGKVFPRLADRIEVVYNGFGTHFRPLKGVTEVVSKYTDQSDYLFFLGNTDPKKNVVRTLVAYGQYVEQSLLKKPLLIADLKESVLDAILKENGLDSLRSYIHLLGYVPNADLPYIYNGAWLFLYTSVRESFGIPLLEAMACGTPVVTGNVSAMPEIAGEGGVLADPFDPQDISRCLLRLETEPAYYQEQVAYALKRVEAFSWLHTAEETLKLYRSIK